MIDTLCDQANEENLRIAGLYCEFFAHQEQTTTEVMGAILKQLVGRGGIPEDIREVFREAKKEVGGRRPLLADLVRMLRIVIAPLPKVFICIDALDECLPKNLPGLLVSLRDIVLECPNARIFLTGRPHIGEAIQRYFTQAVTIHIGTNPDEIRSYVMMRLDKDAEPEAMDDALGADIVKMGLENMSDTYVGAFGISPVSGI